MKKQTVGTVASIAAFAVIATGVIWGSFALREAQSVVPEPTAVVQVQPRGFVSEPTSTPTPTPEPVVEVAPDAAPVEEEAPSGPIQCPPGSTANSNDGVNDTSCFPDICFSISVPNPDHPECDYAFEP